MRSFSAPEIRVFVELSLPVRVEEPETKLQLDSTSPELVILMNDFVKKPASRSEPIDRRQRQEIEHIVQQLQRQVEQGRHLEQRIRSGLELGPEDHSARISGLMRLQLIRISSNFAKRTCDVNKSV